MPEPRIIAVATATPRYSTPQPQAREFAARHFADMVQAEPRLLDVFDNAGIHTRYSCVPLEWMVEERSFAAKNARYVEEAVPAGLSRWRLAVLERAHLRRPTSTTSFICRRPASPRPASTR